MEEKFDKILSNKMKQLSENREIAYNPAHWDMLLAKKNKNKRRIFAYWKYAALLLIALLAGGLGTYFFNNKIPNDAKKHQIIFDEINDSLRIDSLIINPNIEITSIENDSLFEEKSKLNKPDILIGSKKVIAAKEQSLATVATASKSKSINKSNLATNSNNQVTDFLNDSLQNKTGIENDILKDINTKLITLSDENQTKDATFQHKKITLNNEAFGKDSLHLKQEFSGLVEDDNFEQKSTRRAIKLGLNLSPVIDYSQQNISSTIGFSGGVIVEFPILKKFNINTGVYYSNQKLNLNTNQSPSYLADGVGAKESIKIVEEDAVIQGIGIPLNIKYNFIIKENNFFVSTGFSSTSYIKEDIESKQLVNGRTETVTQDSQGYNIVKYDLKQLSETKITSTNSNTFNFANALNFSVGIELPVNNQKQSIIIEPYFKYYLETVTTKQIDYNSVGFHLRYNFNFRKK